MGSCSLKRDVTQSPETRTQGQVPTLPHTPQPPQCDSGHGAWRCPSWELERESWWRYQEDFVLPGRAGWTCCWQSGTGWCPALLLKACPVPQPVLSSSPPVSCGFGGTGPGVVMHGRGQGGCPSPSLVPAKSKHAWQCLHPLDLSDELPVGKSSSGQQTGDSVETH